jgi:hypothetical protein
MRSLEANYNGVLFRSRLEARWAIYFDALKIKWVYEPECVILSNGQKYTPDFYLPDYDLYVEIKPDMECLLDDYHINRYELFPKNLMVFTNSYPCLETVYFGKLASNGVSEFCFCPFDKKYKYFFQSGLNIGEKEGFYKGHYDHALNQVKKYRFY